MDVVGERLERRDVDHLSSVAQPTLEPLADEIVNGGEKRRQRLARAGRRRDQRMAARLDRRPRFGLRGRRGGEVLREPSGDGGMEIPRQDAAIGRAGAAARRAPGRRCDRVGILQHACLLSKAAQRRRVRRPTQAEPEAHMGARQRFVRPAAPILPLVRAHGKPAGAKPHPRWNRSRRFGVVVKAAVASGGPGSKSAKILKPW